LRQIQPKKILLGENLLEVNSKGEKIGNHFNSIYESKKNIFIVAHNNHRKSKIWILDKVTLEVYKIIETEAYWAHNIFEDGEKLIICNSKHGSLYEIYSNKNIWVAPKKILTRGLAATSTHILVGATGMCQVKLDTLVV